MKTEHVNSRSTRETGVRTYGIPLKFSPAGRAQRTREAAARANQLPPEEQMTRFLQWLKIKDGGNEPC